MRGINNYKPSTHPIKHRDSPRSVILRRAVFARRRTYATWPRHLTPRPSITARAGLVSCRRFLLAGLSILVSAILPPTRLLKRINRRVIHLIPGPRSPEMHLRSCPGGKQGNYMNSARARKRRPAFPERFSAKLFVITFLGSHLLLAQLPSKPPAHTEQLILRDHWTLQTSAKVQAKGET